MAPLCLAHPVYLCVSQTVTFQVSGTSVQDVTQGCRYLHVAVESHDHRASGQAGLPPPPPLRPPSPPAGAGAREAEAEALLTLR